MTDRNLRAFFDPASIAVIGASAETTRAGGRVLAALAAAGYPGKIYPVNPNQTEINGLTCYKSIAAIPDSVELAVLWCVPKDAITSWVKVPPGQWSVGPVAGRRFNWVTGWIEALRQTSPWAGERIDGP